MSSLIPILVLGILILVLTGRLVLQWGRKNPAPTVTIEDYAQARAALDSVFVETAAIKRIFADEDKEFVSHTGTPDVQRFFLKERKGLAIQWVSNGLLILLWLFGPFEAVRIVAYTVRVAEYFCSVFSLRLEKIDPVKLSSARDPRSV